VTEHILALLLSFARQLPLAFAAQRQREWVHAENDQVFELAGKTLLLVGLGPIGRCTARVASAFGMRVLAVRRRTAGAEPGVERIGTMDDLPELLPEADFVVLVVPFTAQTHHLIGASALARMKPSAYLINVGRGGLVDEDALIVALAESRIAGAGLDVFEQEPLPAGSPLWDLPNVILTAHYAGVTPDYDRRATAIFLDNLKRYVAGEPLRNVVDKRLGY
jgi:phosphoglycerate dehydrogenase-like enzyme